LSKIESGSSNQNKDLSIKQIKQRIKELQSKLARKQEQPNEATEAKVYHERRMSKSEKEGMKYLKNEEGWEQGWQKGWDQD